MLIKASVIGASGYTGIELIRLLNAHPNVKLQQLISESYAETPIPDIYPHLAHILLDKNFCSQDIEKIAKDSDIVFLALPHTKAAIITMQLLEKDCKVIDLSADLRLKDKEVYSKWYMHQAANDVLLNQAIYGLPEIGLRDKIASGNIIANPGCYATATILGLAPLLTHNLADLSKLPFIIDAKSGLSGAGRNLNFSSHFCEAMNNFSAYHLGGTHRHIPEIEQELARLAGLDVSINFTPHLIPTVRGILATIYCHLSTSYGLAQIYQIYKEYYNNCFFIRILENIQNPGIKSVIGSNFCNISLYLDERTNYLTIISTIDNLIKGASGQAIQNMNLMYNLPETTGLVNAGIYP